MNYTASELNTALAQAERVGDLPMVASIKERIAALSAVPNNGVATSKGRLPNMDAYLSKCIARCRPKAAR